MNKIFLWTSLFISSFIGSYIPVLWGGNVFSVSSIVLSGVGGIAGSVIGYKLGDQFR